MAPTYRAIPESRVCWSTVLIVVTLGTHDQPFDRALDVVEPLLRNEQLVVQHGATRARPYGNSTRWIRFVPYDEFQKLVDAASAVISHAGVGTIMTVLRSGMMPIVIPRLHQHGEHVDDHQLEITDAFASRGLVVPIRSTDDLLHTLEDREGLRSTRAESATVLRASVGAATRRIIRDSADHG